MWLLRTSILFLAVWVPSASGHARAERTRLPSNVRPEHYVLRVTPIFPSYDMFHLLKDSFLGEVRILTRVSGSTQQLVLDAEAIAVREVTVMHQNGSFVPVATFSVDLSNYRLVIELAQPVKDCKLLLHISYRGMIFRESQHGLFAVDYPDVAAKHTRTVLATNLELFGARKLLPCFDEPAMHATFKLILTVPRELSAVGTTVANVVHRNRLSDYYFDETAEIATYLLAFAIGNFTFVESKTINNGHPLTVRIWSHADHAGLLDTALQNTVKCTYALTDYVNFNLDTKIINRVAIGSLSNTWEGFGTIVFDQSILLFNKETDDLSKWLAQFTSQCHEMAHHWFGDIVTTEYWPDLMLHESLATYLSFMAAQSAFPEHSELIKAMQTNAKVITERGSFDDRVIAKGAVLLRQFSFFKPSLQKAVRSYIRKYAYRTGSYKAFLAELEAAGGSKDALSFSAWMERPLIFTAHVYTTQNQTEHPYWLKITSNDFNTKILNPKNEFVPSFSAVLEYDFVKGKKSVDFQAKMTGLGVNGTALLIDPKVKLFMRVVYDDDAMHLLKTAIKSNAVRPLARFILRLVVDNPRHFQSVQDLDELLTTSELRTNWILLQLRNTLIEQNILHSLQ